jgi:2-dehydropantoate 2-reductase
MRCCIVGPGATGGHLAVRLVASGHEVSVVARGAQLAALQLSGLVLELEGGNILEAQVRASDDARNLGLQDLVFVTTKATALRDIAEHLPPLIGQHTTVAFLQNGMTWWYPVGLPASRPPPPRLPIFQLSELFLGMMRRDQVLGGVAYTANEVLRPGLIRNNSLRNSVELAAIDDNETVIVREVRAMLARAGLESPPVPDIRTAIWLKLAGNASASSLCIATGDPAAIVEDGAVYSIFLRMLKECMAVAAAHGYAVADLMDLSRWTRHRARHKPSMLQDFEANRPMEIEEIVLAPTAFARQAGIDTPALDAVTAIAANLAQARGLFRHRR